MKRVLFYLMIPVVLFSCKKEDLQVEVTPRSKVPAELVGKWLRGNFSMTDFWKYDGSYVGNAYTSSQAFNFSKDGHYEFFLMINTTDYNCQTQGFTYQKGTVFFNDDNSFTVYPNEGNYRGFYSCVPGKNFNRPAEKSELKPATYYYDLETDSNSAEWMVIRFKKNDQNGSYFKPVNW